MARDRLTSGAGGQSKKDGCAKTEKSETDSGEKSLSHGLSICPTRAAHLLEPGELLSRFEGIDVLLYEEVPEPDAVARAVLSDAR